MNQATELTHNKPVPTSSDLCLCGNCGEPWNTFTQADGCCHQPVGEALSDNAGATLAEAVAAGQLADTALGMEVG